MYCTHCEKDVKGGFKQFKKHLKNGHNAPFVCGERDCLRRKFRVKTSFIRHLRHFHGLKEDSSDSSSEGANDSSRGTSSGEESVSSSEDESPSDSTSSPDVSSSKSTSNPPSNEDDSSDTNESDDATAECDLHKRLEKSGALMILNLRKKGNVTETAMSTFIKESEKLMKETALATRQQIVSNLKAAGVKDDIVNTNVSVENVQPFKKLKTNEQQVSYFEKHFNFVRPTSKQMGERYDERLDRESGNILPVQVPVCFQYVSAKETLTSVLNNKVMFDLIHSEEPSTDGTYRSFLDGSLAQEHPLIKKYPHTLRLVIYIDDFECANPLGSKAGPHKITAVYFLVQNLPPEENARLRSIHLLAYGYREDLPLDKIVDVLLEPFFEELSAFESEDGVTILVNEEDFTLRATLIALAADCAAAHEVMGLHSPSAGHFCTHCMITKTIFHQDILAQGEPRSKQLHLVHLQHLETKGALFAQKQYAVKRLSSLLVEPKFATFPHVHVKDGMHDILKGIAPMEIKLSLKHFCIKKKYFTVSYLNNALKSFNYGFPDLKNRPLPNISQESLTSDFSYHLRQSAAQTWCFLRIFPFLVGSKVPLDDSHLKLVSLLKRISEIVFSVAVSESDLARLEQLIEEHHKLFIVLYPPPEKVVDLPPDSGEEENDDEDFLLEDAVPQPEANDSTAPAQAKAKPKAPKVIRPINKHHHLTHYPEMIRKSGPAVLYWCMRFEGKHAISKKFAGICCNFKNLPLTMANIHQINHCAELIEAQAVKDQISSSKKSICAAVDTEHFEALCSVGLNEDVVLGKVQRATVGGFSYCVGLYVTLSMTDNLPVFGLIKCIYIHDQKVYIVTKDCSLVEYNTVFGAYQIKDPDEHSGIRVVDVSCLRYKPMASWTADHVSYFLSPRCSLADVIFIGATDES